MYLELNESRIMSMDTLRELCINNKWFTCGTAAAYDNLLNYVDDLPDITTQQIIKIAIEINNNSFTDDDIQNICYKLAKACTYCFS